MKLAVKSAEISLLRSGRSGLMPIMSAPMRWSLTNMAMLSIQQQIWAKYACSVGMSLLPLLWYRGWVTGDQQEKKLTLHLLSQYPSATEATG